MAIEVLPTRTGLVSYGGDEYYVGGTRSYRLKVRWNGSTGVVVSRETDLNSLVQPEGIHFGRSQKLHRYRILSFAPAS